LVNVQFHLSNSKGELSHKEGASGIGFIKEIYSDYISLLIQTTSSFIP